MDEEAILKLLQGNDRVESSSMPSDSLSSVLDKVASLEDMPEDMSALLKEASLELAEKEMELEYIKLAYEMATKGVIPYEDVMEKAHDLKEEGKDPQVIKEAMELDVSFRTPFGKAEKGKANTSSSGMYSVIKN